MADTPSGPSFPAAAGKSSLVGSTKEFLLWLGGSLAGLTAILYTTGYLVTRAHLSLLGLYGLIDFGNDYFLQEDAKFFLVVVYSFGRTAVLPLLSLIGAVGIAALVLKRVLRHTRVKHWYDKLRTFLPDFGTDDPWRVVVFLLLFLVFLEHADNVLVRFQLPLCITNLLYVDVGTVTCPSSMQERAKALKAALLNRDETVLNDAFSELVISIAQAALLAYLIWRLVLSWRWRAWFVAPPLVAVVFYLISLPMVYGVLQRPINYPRITLTLDEKAEIAGPLYLLSKTANDFVVWDASVRKLLWIPASSVKRAEVGGVYDLFASPSGRPAVREEKK